MTKLNHNQFNYIYDYPSLFDYDYIMSYDKFQKKFPKCKATQMEEGLRNMITSFQK
jgi:hypothetical protein